MADVCQPGPIVVEQKQWLTVRHIIVNLLDQVIRMSVRDQEIEVAVVVIVKELKPPSAHEFGCIGNPRRTGNIVESLVMAVPVERVELVSQIRHEQIHPTILVEIRGIDSHTRPRFSAFAVRNTAGESDFLKT